VSGTQILDELASTEESSAYERNLFKIFHANSTRLLPSYYNIIAFPIKSGRNGGIALAADTSRREKGFCTCVFSIM